MKLLNTTQTPPSWSGRLQLETWAKDRRLDTPLRPLGQMAKLFTNRWLPYLRSRNCAGVQPYCTWRMTAEIDQE